MIELDHPDIEPRMQRHLRLIHRPTGQVVTVMELLSPVNKASGEDGLEAYLEKCGGVPGQRLSSDRV